MNYLCIYSYLLMALVSCSPDQSVSNYQEPAKQIQTKDSISSMVADSNPLNIPKADIQYLEKDSSISCPCAISGFIEMDSIYIWPKLYETFYEGEGDKNKSVIKLNNQGAFFLDVDACFVPNNSSGMFRIANINRGGTGKELNKYRKWWVGGLYVNGPDNEFKYNIYSDTLRTDVIDYTLSTTFQIFECRGRWIYTKGIHKHAKDGKYIPSKSGWMPFEMLCSNPFTNCADLKWEKHLYKGNTLKKE